MRLSCFICLMLFAALVSGQDHSQAKSPNAKTNQTDQHREVDASSPAQRSTEHGTAEAGDSQNDTKQESRPWLTHGEWVMSGLTLVYVGLTGFYAWTSHKTLKAIKDQGIHAKEEATARDKQFAEQLKVSQETSAAALLNATAAVESERAWVVIGYEPSTRPGNIELFAVNLGRSPAKIKSFHSGYVFLKVEEEMEPEPDYGKGEFMPTIVLPSMQRRLMDSWQYPAIIPAESQAAKDLVGKRTIYYGRIQYLDIVEKPHETRFCYLYKQADGYMVEWGPPIYREHT